LRRASSLRLGAVCVAVRNPARQFRAIFGNVCARMRVRAVLFMKCGDSSPFIKPDEVYFLIEESEFKSYDH
jgi:hypothetical protein